MPDLSQKLVDEELRFFASEKEDCEGKSVIVELAYSAAPVNPKLLRPSDPRQTPQSNRRNAPDETINLEIQALDGLESVLKSAGISEVVRLSNARAFVICATPTQVREIASSPLVESIRSNRTHTLPRNATRFAKA